LADASGTQFNGGVRRGTAGVLGGSLLATWWLVQNLLAIFVMLGLGAVLLAHALAGVGPEARWPLAAEVGALAITALLGVGVVAGIAYLV
jgi:hypothetical protein